MRERDRDTGTYTAACTDTPTATADIRTTRIPATTRTRCTVDTGSTDTPMEDIPTAAMA